MRKSKARPSTSSKHRPSGNYVVGYKQPPVEYRFKPGQSGNQKGRPKGIRNTATEVSEILNQKIVVSTGERVRKMSVRQAILTRHAEAAIKGNIRAAEFLLELEQQLNPIIVHQDEMFKTEEEIKAALMARGLPESMLRQLQFHDPKLFEDEEEDG